MYLLAAGFALFPPIRGEGGGGGARKLPSGFCGLAVSVSLTLVCVAQLLPEEEDDMWHAYNLIGVGDHLEAVTVR
jgi:hypothetical protein